MKAIQVTQDLKDNNKEFFINNNVGDIVQKSLPIRFHGVENILGDYRTRNDLQALDGWKDIVIPPVNNAIEKRGNELILSGNTYTYEVIDLTEAEIVATLKGNAESEREQAIQERLKEQVVNDAQAIVDDAEALENSVLYPFWESAISVALNDKYQFFVGTELQLFKVVQAHTSQEDWTPPQVPALFTRVQLGDVILDFKQPTGAQDAYNTGDKVMFEGNVWESVIDANVWSPTDYPQGWTML